METNLTETIFLTTVTFISALIIILFLRRISHFAGLVDKPDARKVHSTPVPLVGGIAIISAMCTGLFFVDKVVLLSREYPMLICGCLFLLLTGVLDDRFSVKPRTRLLIQAFCAAAVAAGGIRITSLYGVLGIEELTVPAQYILTIVVITGVTNAFNLIDGIDGLAGSIALVNLSVLAFLSWQLQQHTLFLLLVSAAGGVLAFLKNNLQTNKIFMGDGGSLSLGFLMVVSGITLLEKEHEQQVDYGADALIIVPALMLLPALDSLRVYAGRMMRGGSPFRADKTHLHHLLLDTGFNHRRAAAFIVVLHLIILATSVALFRSTNFGFAFFVAAGLFLVLCGILSGNSSLFQWSQRLRKMEESGL